jgi:glycosyltransferase involved in cell wall biosynthesis
VNVVFLTHNFPRWDGDVSGAFLATLAQALRGRGHDVRVVAPSDEGETGAAEYKGIPVRRVRYAAPSREVLAYRGTMARAARTPSRWPALYGLFRALRRATREELSHGAQVVHAHWWVPGGLAAPPEAPLVLTVHGTDGMLLTRSHLARLLAHRLFQRAPVVTAVSASLARVVAAETGRPVRPDAVAPMPVEVARFTGWSRGGGGVVVVARLTDQKRVELALRALAVLRKKGRTLALTAVGDGPARSRLERLARDLGMDGLVRFAGTLSPAEVAGLLMQADLMLFPAVGEGLGLAAAEALMAGVPVVACRDGGGVLDVVPSSGAGRVADPEPEAVANAALSLLDDPDAGNQARRLGTTWRERLNPETVAARCEEWYEEALRG